MRAFRDSSYANAPCDKLDLLASLRPLHTPFSWRLHLHPARVLIFFGSKRASVAPGEDKRAKSTVPNNAVFQNSDLNNVHHF